MKKIINRFNIIELTILAFMAALGIAIKPFIMPLVYLISTPLLIPGGSLAGGFYMLWIILGASLINKPFSATLIGFMQALMVVISGSVGNHGLLSFIIYVIPGVVVDIIIYMFRNNEDKKSMMFIACAFANLSGLVMTNIFIYNLAFIPLMTSFTIGIISGGIGGLISYQVYNKIIKLNIMENSVYNYE